MSALKQHEFRPIAVEIEEAPLPIWEWLTLATIVTTVSATVGFLTLGEVDVVVSAQGKVIPQGQILLIQPLETGVVRELKVKPGDFVHKGQTLVEIEPELIEPEILSAWKELDTLSLQKERTMALIGGGAFVPSAAAHPECTSLNVSVPLFDGFKNAAMREKKRAEIDRLVLERDKKIADLKLQAEKFSTSAKQYSVELQISAELVNTSKEKAAMVKKLNAHQLVDLGAVINEQISVIDHRLSLQKARTMRISALRKAATISTI